MVKNYKTKVEFITLIKEDNNLSQLKLETIGSIIINENYQKLYFQTTQSNQEYQLEVYINNGTIKIKQLKPNTSTLEFDSMKRTYATYVTDYGSLELPIKTSKLVTKPGYILIEYEIENQSTSNNRFAVEINYKELM